MSEEKASVQNRAGQFLKIQLVNFMCHENLVINFNRRVNYLIGSNGSGKSAIITAIVIGLGGRASDTNRSDSIKKLIRNGATSSVIRLYVSNDDGSGRRYNYESFGDTVIIERHLSASGSSTYKLCNEHGKTISSSAKELRQMLAYLNIHVENPLIVLNQEAAKTFLRKNDPKQFYKLFMKATYVEHMLEASFKCANEHENYKKNLTKLMLDYDKEKYKYHELKNEVAHLVSLQGIKEVINTLRLELKWTMVSDQECLMAEHQRDIQSHQVEMDKWSNELTNRAAKEKDLKTQISLHQNQQEVAIGGKNEIRGSLVTISAELNELENEKMSNESNVKKLEANRQQSLQSIKEIEEHLRNIPSNAEIEEKKLADKNNLDIWLKTSSEIEAILENAKRDHSRIEQTILAHKDNLQSAQQKIQSIKRELNATNENLKDIRSKTSSMVEYGRHMPQLLSTIKRLHEQGRFSQMPLGPLGSYIQVTDAKYRGVIEQIISPAILCGFMVDNDKDRMTLKRLIDSEFKSLNLTIITSKFTSKKYDIRNGKVQETHNAIAAVDTIIVEDPNVYNCLIDQTQIELILLVNTLDEGTRLCIRKESVPRGLKKVFVLDPGTEIFPAPRYRMYALNLAVRYLQVDKKELEQNCLRTLERNKQQLQEAQQPLNDMVAQLKRNQSLANEKRQERAQHESKLTELRTKIDDIKNKEYQIGGQNDFFTSELSQLKSEEENISKRLQAEKDKLASVRDKIAAVYAEKQDAENRMRNFDEQQNQIRDTIVDLQAKLDRLGSDEQFQKHRLLNLNTALSKLHDNLAVEDLKYSNLVTAASEMGERVTAKRSVDAVRQEIKEKESKQKTLNQSMRTLDEAKQELTVAVQNLKSKKTHMERVEEIRKNLKIQAEFLLNSGNNRRDCFQRILRSKFSRIMKLRDFNGQIDVDYTKETLTLMVKPRQNAVDTSVSNAKSLSGGECSYSTLALMISLWACIDHPFLCLDEYDVFTDQVNREFMNKLLMRDATYSANRQYILLTPQDMSNLEQNDMISIHRMAPPRR